MLPTPNSVWFAKMKGSYKNLIITNMDHDLINKVILSTGFLGIEASKKLPLSLLTAFIISEQFNNQRDLNSVGTTMAGINNETFKKIEVPKLNYDEISKYELDYKNYIYQLSYLRRKIDKLLQIKSSLLAKYFN